MKVLNQKLDSSLRELFFCGKNEKNFQKETPAIYHEMFEHHFAKPGKRLRSQMIFDLTEVLGAKPEESLPWATSCESFHNGTLVHDDLQDGDTERRGQESIWKKFGAREAINFGDLLMTLAPEAVLKSDLCEKKRHKLLQIFSLYCREVIYGQSLEFGLKSSNNLSKDYLNCVRLKTAALFARAAQGVAVITESEEEEIYKIFETLGVCFQWQDDVLDLFGDKKRDVVGCDILEGKMSFLVVNHLEEQGREGEEEKKLLSILSKSREDTSTEDVQFCKELFLKDTLQKSITKISQVGESLKTNDFLKDKPALQTLTLEFYKKLTHPISHLL